MGRTLLWTINVADSKNTRRAIKHGRGGDGRPRFNLMLALGCHSHTTYYMQGCVLTAIAVGWKKSRQIRIAYRPSRNLATIILLPSSVAGLFRVLCCLVKMFQGDGACRLRVGRIREDGRHEFHRRMSSGTVYVRA